MVKRILIPLDPSPYTDTAIEYGCRMAKENGAELTGMVILDIPGIERAIGPVPLGGIHFAEDLEKHKKLDAEKRIHILLDVFKEKCETHQVPYRVAELQGLPSEQILKESIFYDLIIVGLKTFYRFDSEERPGDSLNKLMDQSATPILAVPANFKLPDFRKEKLKVLIAFDGSFPAARAIQRFASLIKGDIAELTILFSTKDKTKADYYFEQATEYLEAHGFNNINTVWGSESISDMIDLKWFDWADSIVLGAHSRNYFTKYTTGRLTKHLIDKGNTCLFIGQ